MKRLLLFLGFTEYRPVRRLLGGRWSYVIDPYRGHVWLPGAVVKDHFLHHRLVTKREFYDHAL